MGKLDNFERVIFQIFGEKNVGVVLGEESKHSMLYFRFEYSHVARKWFQDLEVYCSKVFPLKVAGCRSKKLWKNIVEGNLCICFFLFLIIFFIKFVIEFFHPYGWKWICFQLCLIWHHFIITIQAMLNEEYETFCTYLSYFISFPLLHIWVVRVLFEGIIFPLHQRGHS